jgi:hypothetical protein
MTKSERMTKPECPNGQRIEGQFDIRASDFFRPLAFGFRIFRLLRFPGQAHTTGTASLKCVDAIIRPPYRPVGLC